MSDYLQIVPPEVRGNEAAEISFFVKSLLSGVRTSMPVQVVAVTNEGGVSPIGKVDIKPLVGQLDGFGNVYKHGVIYGVPYLRIQGGNNAVIIDPKVDDIGIASFCDRDISTVISTKAEGPPGSARKHDFSDAVYHHSILNAAPTQYIQFNDEGITVNSPSKVTVIAPETVVNASTSTVITSPTNTVNGNLIVNGNTSFNGTLAQTGGGTATFSGSINATGNITGAGKSLATHTHNETGTVTSGPN